MKKLLSVVIPTHGRPTLLKRTLVSLEACTLPESYHELVIIENGSRDGVKEMVAALPDYLNARYLHTPRGNKSHALNVALQQIEDGLIFFTDDDVRFHPSILLHYAHASVKRGAGTFFGGPTDVDYEVVPPEWLRTHLPNSATGWALTKTENEHDDLFMGFNWAAFRTDLDLIDGFNPLYGPGSPTKAVGQETEFQQRLADAGVRQFFIPEAKVWHRVPASRSTPQWVLKRKFREGVKAGLDLDAGALSMFGVPGLCYRLMASTGDVLMQIIKGNEPQCFSEAVKMCRHTGIVYGYLVSNNKFT